MGFVLIENPPSFFGNPTKEDLEKAETIFQKVVKEKKGKVNDVLKGIFK